MAYTKEEQQANRKAWIKALRSGKYEQGHHRLRSQDIYGNKLYCCLGVACDISGLGEWKSGENQGSLYLDEVIVLPLKVMEWLGVRTEEGAFSESLSEFTSLIGWNDSGCSFNEIADIIESEPEGLFVED